MEGYGLNNEEDEPKAVKYKVAIPGEKVKMREGILDYRIEEGVFIPRPLTECEKEIKKWGACVKEGVRISCVIDPTWPPRWNYDERALFVVIVANRTGYFRLSDIVVELANITSAEGKADVSRASGSPNVVRLPNLRPGATANSQNPTTSWCNGVKQTPARPGFTLSCAEVFEETDVITARARIEYIAEPFFQVHCKETEPIFGT